MISEVEELKVNLFTSEGSSKALYATFELGRTIK